MKWRRIRRLQLRSKGSRAGRLSRIGSEESRSKSCCVVFTNCWKQCSVTHRSSVDE